MWEDIERLQQGESLNIQDVKTNIFWEFGKFTSHDGETMESYYTRFYKLMNEMIRNNLIVVTLQVNVQEVNKLCAERLARKANPLALKNLTLIAKYFKKIYKPTNNNLRTFSYSRNKNVDTTPWYKNDNQSGQFRNQRTMNVVGARENKAKRVKDSAYHKEKMLLCKQTEQGVPLQAEQYDWLADMDEEIDEQVLEAHYSYMAKIQEVLTVDKGNYSEPVEQVQNDVGYNVFANDLQHSEQSESVSNTCLVESDDSNVIPDSPDMCNDDIQNDQNDVESDDERVTLANLKLDVDENKKIQKSISCPNCSRYGDPDSDMFMPLAIKTQNDSFLFVHELKQEMHADLKYVESLEKEIDELESDKAEFSNIYDMILQECVSKDVMCSYFLLLSDLDALDELQCLYLHEVKECDCLAQKLSNQTESVSKKVKNDIVWNEKASNVFRKEHEQYFKIQDLKAQLQDKNIAISELKKLIEKGKGKFMDTKFDKPYVVRQPNAQRIPKPSVLGVNHKTNVSRPHHRSNQLKDMAMPNNSQVKLKKTQVEVHPKIPSVSNKMKSVTAYKDSLNSRTLNANAVLLYTK
nr:hypothetical protein [Tanacetum cinerariifolium]